MFVFRTCTPRPPQKKIDEVWLPSTSSALDCPCLCADVKLSRNCGSSSVPVENWKAPLTGNPKMVCACVMSLCRSAFRTDELRYGINEFVSWKFSKNVLSEKPEFEWSRIEIHCRWAKSIKSSQGHIAWENCTILASIDRHNFVTNSKIATLYQSFETFLHSA